MTTPTPPAANAAIVEPAPAKLNLALHVRRRRNDGYHDLETLFVFCRDGDTIALTDATADQLTVTGSFAAALGSPDAPAWPADNLVTRAADAFRRAFGVEARHAITLEKNLPVASGIGGGSADAAATLRALARRHGVMRNDPRLHAVAAGLGADVPACLLGRTAFGTGKGDALVALDAFVGTPVLLVNPGVAVSTAAVFAGWDGHDRGPLHPADPLAGRNDLEPAARVLAPVIDTVIARLTAQPGARLARMSGSGATCFALFETPAQASAAAATIAAAHPDWWQLATTLA